MIPAISSSRTLTLTGTFLFLYRRHGCGGGAQTLLR